MMPKKRLLYALMIYAYIANSLILGNFSFTDLTKIFIEWSIIFGMWWVRNTFIIRKKVVMSVVSWII